MSISIDHLVARQQILILADDKGISYKLRKGCNHTEYDIKETWYVFGGGQLIMENHDYGRSEIGLLTTNYNIQNDINIQDKLKWENTFGRSRNRFQYKPFGKSLEHISRIFDIMIKVDELNKLKPL